MHDEPRINVSIPLGRAVRLAELLMEVARDPNFTSGIFPATRRADYRAAWSEMHDALQEASRILLEAADAFAPSVNPEAQLVGVPVRV